MKQEATALLGVDSANYLQQLPESRAKKIIEELKTIPKLETTSASVVGIPGDNRYRALALPSGYSIVYRKLGPNESGRPPSESVYLVAQIKRD